MSAILGTNIGNGPRWRSPSTSPASSKARSTTSRSVSPVPFGGRRGRARPYMAVPRRPKQQTPQAAVDEFWAKFTTKTPGKATTALPQDKQLVERVVRKKAQSSTPSAGAKGADRAVEQSTGSRPTQASYNEAAAVCRAKVAQIVKECRRINKKYRDPHFDLESDLKLGRRDCLQSLSNDRGAKTPPGGAMCPRSAKRVTEIFDRPQFYIDGPTANDVRQGRDGDCWLMSALCTLSNKAGLIERLCVAHDQDVGVYGFVFHRDGEWISEIVDDFLYLIKSDYDESFTDRILFDDIERVNPDEAYRRIYQSNSSALYFAQCEHPQETWLPLLEKGYAKAHGDYAAIEGGFGGEGTEDLTGGVTSEIFTTDILDKEYFWKEELLKVNQDFLFDCSTGVWGGSSWGERKGIVELHAYSIQRAVEIDGKRLVRLKNPWGKGEWKGPWSDGSKEWTPEWLEKLGHRFGDDGDFWIAYEDLLRKYQAFERTRLFDDDWSVAQIWTTLSVPWMVDYHSTYFSLSLSKPGPVVIVLSQLDERYFRGLQGQYEFELALRLHRVGQEDDNEDYIVRSQTPYRMRRSVNVELELEAGDYQVRVKLDAVRNEDLLPMEQVIRDSAKDRRKKLMRIGLAYDLAHGKGKAVETAEEKAAREAHEKKAEEKRRKEARNKIQAGREEAHYLKTKEHERARERQRNARAKHKTRLAAREARREAARQGASQRDEADEKNEEGAAEATPVPDGAVEAAGQRQASASAPEDGKPGLPSGAGDMHKPAAGDCQERQPGSPLPSDGANTTRAENGSVDVPELSDVVVVKRSTSPDDGAARPAAERRPVMGSAAAMECESESDFGPDDADELTDLSDRELDIQVRIHLEQVERRPRPLSPAWLEEELDEFERDPWNAVAVVGLRVYHRHKTAGGGDDDEVVRLSVVRRDPFADGDADAPGDETESKSRELDVDDSAKDATLVDAKRSIAGGAGQ